MTALELTLILAGGIVLVVAVYFHVRATRILEEMIKKERKR